MFVDGVVRPLGHVPNSNRTVCWDFVFAIALCVEFDMSTVGRFGESDPTSGQTTALLWNKVQTADFCYVQKKMFSDKWRTHVPLRWQNGKIAVALWFWTELFTVDISWVFLTWTLWICGKPFLALLGTLRLTRCCSLRRWGLRGAGGQGQVRTGWNCVFDLRFFWIWRRLTIWIDGKKQSIASGGAFGQTVGNSVFQTPIIVGSSSVLFDLFARLSKVLSCSNLPNNWTHSICSPLMGKTFVLNV